MNITQKIFFMVVSLSGVIVANVFAAPYMQNEALRTASACGWLLWIVFSAWIVFDAPLVIGGRRISQQINYYVNQADTTQQIAALLERHEEKSQARETRLEAMLSQHTDDVRTVIIEYFLKPLGVARETALLTMLNTQGAELSQEIVEGEWRHVVTVNNKPVAALDVDEANAWAAITEGKLLELPAGRN